MKFLSPPTIHHPKPAHPRRHRGIVPSLFGTDWLYYPNISRPNITTTTTTIIIIAA